MHFNFGVGRQKDKCPDPGFSMRKKIKQKLLRYIAIMEYIRQIWKAFILETSTVVFKFTYA